MKNFKEFLDAARTDNFEKALSGVKRGLASLTGQCSAGMVVERTEATASESVRIWAGRSPSSPAFFAWLNGIGVAAKVGMKLPDFADGGVGRAYFVGAAPTVVKFTPDHNEYQIAKMLAGDLKGPARVIGVHELSSGLWAIAQEFIKTGKNISAKLSKAADILQGGYLDDHPETETSGLPRDATTKFAIARSLAANYAGGDPEIVAYIIQVIDLLNSLFDKTGFMHDDAGPTNIGVAKDGAVVVTDLGPNRNSVIDAGRRLSQAHANRAASGLNH